MRSPRRAYLLLAALVGAGAAMQSATAQTPGPKYDPEINRSVPAGPYSSVDTLNGSLMTTVPIVSLPVVGGLSLEVSLTHRSNHASGLPYGLEANKGVAAGWSTDLYRTCEGYTDNSQQSYVRETRMSVPTQYWPYTIYSTANSQTWNFSRQLNGLYSAREDITRLVDSRGNPTGYAVTSFDGRITKYYTHQSHTNGAVFLLDYERDLHNNRVTYTYDSGHPTYDRITRVAETMGDGTTQRYVDLVYSATEYNTPLSQIVLTTPDGKKTWDLTRDAQTHTLLGAINMPTISGQARASVQFHYDVNTNIDYLYDLRGAQWHFNYRTDSTPMLALGTSDVVVDSFSPPNPDNHINPDGTRYWDANRTWFRWEDIDYTSSGSANALRCDIGSWYTTPDKNRTATRRYAEHVYDFGVYTRPFGGGTITVSNPAFLHPVLQVTDPYQDGSTARQYERYTWDEATQMLTAITDRMNNTWSYAVPTYTPPNGAADDHRFVCRGLVGYVNDPATNIVFRTYDPDSHLLASVARLVDYTTVNNKRVPVVTTDTYGYNSGTLDLSSKTVDYGGRGYVTSYTYDTIGNMTSSKTGSDASTTYGGYYFGKATQVTPPSGLASQMVTYSFDALGHPTGETEPSPGGKTTITNDEWGRPTSVARTRGDGTTVTTSKLYDNDGNVVQATDGNGHTSVSTYDYLNRLTDTDEQVDGNAAHDVKVHHDYDLGNRMVTTTNGLGLKTQRYLNARDQQIGIAYPDGRSVSNAYYADGALWTSTNGRSLTTTYAYDWYGHVIKKIAPDKSYTQFTYRYDGLCTGQTPSVGKGYAWSYDAMGELQYSSQPVAIGTSSTYTTVNYAYDPSTGRKLSMAVEPGGGPSSTVFWKYYYSDPKTGYGDANYRLAKVTRVIGSQETLVAGYRYYDSGAVKSRNMGAGLRTDYVPYATGEAWSVTHSSVGSSGALTSLLKAQYLYDGDGNVSQCTVTDAAYKKGTPYVTTYGYDYANRLTSETQGSGPQASTNAYGYDADDNRVSATFGPLSVTYTNANGAAASTPGDWFQSSSDNAYAMSSYDADGDPQTVKTPKGTQSLTYDYEGRVLTLSGGSVSASYAYRPDGLRSSKTVGGVTTAYLYDGSTVVAEVGGSSSGTVRYFVPGVGFTEEKGSASVLTDMTFTLENGLGSALATASPSGAVLSRTDYDAYGNERLVTAPAASVSRGPFRFVGTHGYVSDDESGLDLLGDRYYLPGIGRFLTQDPIGEEGGLNLYAYCSDNPLIKVDPDGHQDRGFVDNVLSGKTAVIFMGDPGHGEWWERRINHEGDHWLAMKYANRLNLMGYRAYIYAPDTVKEAQKYLRGADAVVLIGHGRSMFYRNTNEHYGGIMLSDDDGSKFGTRLGAEDLLNALDGRKLDHIYVFACGQGMPDLLPGWFRTSFDVNAASYCVAAGSESEQLTHYKPRK